ncbi:MAG: hypothetical protein M3Q53_02120 [Actinomycetota bacterium]|nr:hypothetical protein [Actinomycetota bacterium]
MRAAQLRSADGFTVVESLVAALLLVIGAIAVLSAFDGAQRASYRAEQAQVASDLAQRELEALRSIAYGELALSSTPTPTSATTDPRNRIVGSEFALNKEGTDLAAMAIDTTSGTVDPGPEAFNSGDVSGTVQRYIVWRNDPNCLDVLCGGQEDFKRAIVAVTIDASPAGGAQSYLELQSDMIDPNDSVGSNPNLPLLGDPTVAQQFWLSDEPCKGTGEPAHSAALSSHGVRNTFGTSCTGSNPAAINPPDALLTDAPTNLDATHDFSADLEPASPPTPAPVDAGLQFLVPDANGCSLKPNGSNGYKQQHIWVSRRLNGTAAYVLTGGATLKLWTRSIDDIMTPGKLCVILFERTETELLGVLSATVDTTIASATPTYSAWPRGQWQEFTVQLPYSALTLPRIGSVGNILNQRLGIAIGLDKQGSPSDQLMFQYDHVDFESRLEVETTTPIG